MTHPLVKELKRQLKGRRLRSTETVFVRKADIARYIGLDNVDSLIERNPDFPKPPCHVSEVDAWFNKKWYIRYAVPLATAVSKGLSVRKAGAELGIGAKESAWLWRTLTRLYVRSRNGRFNGWPKNVVATVRSILHIIAASRRKGRGYHQNG